jgi:hypothetical protein
MSLGSPPVVASRPAPIDERRVASHVMTSIASPSGLNKRLILGVWFAGLAVVAALAWAIGPEPSHLAVVSTGEGLFITAEAIYASATAFAAIASLLVVHICLTGANGLLELDESSDAAGRAGRRVALTAAYVAAGLAACYFVFVGLRGSVICTMPHDAFVYYDGAQRFAHGKVQHVDFHTPMGALCNVIPYLGYVAAGQFAGSMEMGSWLATALLLALAAYVLGTRYTLAAAIPVVLFLCLLGVVPLGIESTPDNISTAMFYNRLGWIALTLTFLFYVEPRDPTPRRVPLDSLCLAALLLFAFYLKMSFGLVGLAFLPLIAISSRHNSKVAVGAVAAFLLAAGALELRYGFHRGYVEDLRMTLKACGANRGTMAPKFFANIREFLLAGIAFLLAMGCVRNKFRFFLMTGYICAAGLAIIDQNTHRRGVICLIALFLIAQESIRRSLREQSDSSPRRSADSLKCLACLSLVVIFVVQPTVYAGASMTMIRSVLTQVKPELPGGLNGMVFPEHLWGHLRAKNVQAKRTSGLVSAPPPPAGGEAERIYLKTLLDGVELLQRNDVSDKHVIVFDFVPPFSFILGLEPPTGDTTCIAYGRTMSENSFTPPSEFLGNVDYVMIPKSSMEQATTDFLLRTYGDYLTENFQESGESKYWMLETRTTPRERPSGEPQSQSPPAKMAQPPQ